MIVNLDVPFVDSQVEDLSFSSTVEALPVLESIETSLPAGRLSLRLLGASHQAVVTLPDGSRYAETVACLPEATPGVPGQFTTRLGGWRFDFSCQVRKVSSSWLHGHCDRLRRYSRSATVLLGVFPGESNALTYLDVSSDLGGWNTQHCYPESNSVVRTRTTLTPAGDAESVLIPGGQYEK